MWFYLYNFAETIREYYSHLLHYKYGVGTSIEYKPSVLQLACGVLLFRSPPKGGTSVTKPKT